MYKSTTFWYATKASLAYIYEALDSNEGYNGFLRFSPKSNSGVYADDISSGYSWSGFEIRPATDEETKWFKVCKTSKEFIPKEIALMPNRILKSDLKKIHDIACAAWKSIIIGLAANPDYAFDNFVVLKDDMVKDMFIASDAEQKIVLKQYLPEPKPPFKSKDLLKGQIMSCNYNNARFIGRATTGALYWIGDNHTMHTHAGALANVEGQLLSEGTEIKIVAN